MDCLTKRSPFPVTSKTLQRLLFVGINIISIINVVPKRHSRNGIVSAIR